VSLSRNLETVYRPRVTTCCGSSSG